MMDSNPIIFYLLIATVLRGYAIEVPSAPTQSLPDVQHPRVVRDAANAASVETAVDRMRKIARVTNGISLVQSIGDDTFHSDDVFSELLRMGQLTPSQVKDIDVAAIQESLESLATLPLQDTPELDKFFAIIKNIERVLEGMDDVTNWKKNDFEEEMKKLENFDVPFHSQMTGLLGDWTSAYRKLTKAAPAQDLATTKYELSKLKSSSEGILNILYSTDANQNLTYEFTKIQSAASGFSTVGKAAEGADLYGTIHINERDPLSKPEKTSANSANYKAVEAAAKSILPIESLLVNIRSLYENQKIGNMRVLSATIGFPNGFEDLGSVNADLLDSWILKIVKTSVLTAALQPLFELKSGLEGTSDSFGKLEGQQLQQMNAILDILEHLKFNGLPKPSEAEEKVRKCVEDFQLQKKLDGMDEMRAIAAEVLTVDAVIAEMNDQVWRVIADMKTSKLKKGLEKAIQMSSNLNTDDDYQKASASLKSDNAMTELFKKLDKIHLKSDKPEKVIEAAKNITSKLASCDPFLADVSKLSETFKCIQVNSPAVTSMTRTIKKLRDLKKNGPMVTGVVEVVKKIKETAGMFDALDAYIAAVKEVWSRETKVLAAQSSLKTHSSVIGTATKGVVTMHNVIQKPLSFDSQKWGRLVEGEMRKIVVPLDAHTLSMLRHVNGIGKSLKDFHRALKTWSSGVKNPDSDALADYSDLFGKASKVVGVNIELSAVADAVKTLKRAIPAPSATTSSSQNKRAVGQHDTLDGLLSELERLATMGLKLSEYSFGDAAQSLQELDEFFTKFADAAQEPPTGAGGGGPSGAQQATSPTNSSAAIVADNASTTAAPGIDTGTIVGYSIAAVVVVGLIAFLVYWFLIRDSKNKEDHDDSENSDNPKNHRKKGKKKGGQNNASAEENKRLKKTVAQQQIEIEKNIDNLAVLREENTKQSHELMEQQLETDRLERDNQYLELQHKEDKAQHKRDKKLVEKLKVEKKETSKAAAAMKAKVINPKFPPMKFDYGVGFTDGLTGQLTTTVATELEKEKKKLRAEKKDPLGAQVLTDEDAFALIFRNILLVINADTANAVKMDVQFYNQDIRHKEFTVIKDTRILLKTHPAVWFKTSFYHGSIVTMPNQHKMILCQSPHVTDKKANLSGNVDKFLWLIHEKKVDKVVMLCPLKSSNGEDVCARYYAENPGDKILFNRCKVKCLEKEVTDHFIFRLHQIEFKNGIVYKYQQYQYLDWPENSAPAHPESTLEILRQVRCGTNPVIVHCADGVGASGAFALIEYGYQTLAKTGALGLSVALGQLRTMRAHAVQNENQLAFAAVAIMEFALVTKDVAKKESVDDRKTRLLNLYHAMLERREMRPEPSVMQTAPTQED